MERDTSGRASSMRPPSTISVPRTAALMSSTSRPLTRQGLTGLKPTTAGGQRIYKDKRYYMAMVQNKNTAIRDEVARLRKVTEENRLKTLNLEDMRKKAKEAAKRIEEQQELLAAYNITLEMHISKTKEQEVISEIDRVKRDNELKMKELDGLFAEKMKLQERFDNLQRDRDERDKAMKAMIDNLPDAEREQYFGLEREMQSVQKEICEIQEEINKDKENIEKYKGMIQHSPELQEKFQLLQTIQRLEAQKAELTAFLTNTQTPAEQRESLLQQIKQDKADIEALQKLSESLEQESNEMETKVAEIDKELDSKDSARLKKHRELREREAHMDALIDSYPEKSSAAVKKIEQVNKQIHRVLDVMSDNLAELNLDEFGKVQVDVSDQSLESWNKRCAALADQKEKLEAYKTRFDAEIVRLQTKKSEMLNEIDHMSDVEMRKVELMREKDNLEEDKHALYAKLESTQSAVSEANRRKQELTKKLEDNPMYHKVVQIEKEIEELENKKREIEAMIEADKSNTALEDIANNVRALLEERNNELINKLRNKK